MQEEINQNYKKETDEIARGYTQISNGRQNFYILFGCAPANGVKADTGMVFDISDIFFNKIEVETLSLIIP